jgi:hypothetical protein
MRYTIPSSLFSPKYNRLSLCKMCKYFSREPNSKGEHVITFCGKYDEPFKECSLAGESGVIEGITGFMCDLELVNSTLLRDLVDIQIKESSD